MIELIRENCQVFKTVDADEMAEASRQWREKRQIEIMDQEVELRQYENAFKTKNANTLLYDIYLNQNLQIEKFFMDECKKYVSKKGTDLTGFLCDVTIDRRYNQCQGYNRKESCRRASLKRRIMAKAEEALRLAKIEYLKTIFH